MLLPDNIKCKICGKIFCCEKCRKNHETKERNENTEKIIKINEIKSQIPNNTISCPICDNNPLILYPKISDHLMKHIAENHLPLKCKKCSKIYNNDQDFMMFTKCFKEQQKNCDLMNMKSLNTNSTSIGIQTSPFLNSDKTIDDYENVNDVLTPLFHNNLICKTKDKCCESVGSITDSVSSIKNFSSITNSANQKIVIETNVRTKTTSTPVPAGLVKANQKAYDGISCQVSSIHCISSSTESDNSATGQTSESPPIDQSKPNEKNTSLPQIKGRPRLPPSATPLRQLMSKSIQKALIQQRMSCPKKIFDSTDGSVSFSMNSPLDLRTSPAIRRTKSEVIGQIKPDECKAIQMNMKNNRKELYFTSKTESIYISAIDNVTSSNTIYKTCQSIDIVTSTTTSGYQKEIKDNSMYSYDSIQNCNNNVITSKDDLFTPKISGPIVPLKKTISFEFSNLTGDSSSDVSDDIFYTPPKISSGIEKFSESSKIKFTKNEFHDKSTEKENLNKKHDNESTDNQQKGGLWSKISSLIRFNSFNSKTDNKKNETSSSSSSSIIKRCASFAGVLTKRRTSTEINDLEQIYKRKRTSTLDSQVQIPILQQQQQHFDYTWNSPPKRIRRIHGRKPIERMRNLS